jgi:tRNA-uridine 2-sulfurtransferase
METGKTVFVGLSGGVDSSVAAARLLARGYNVVGVFIKVWHPEFMVCNWEQERLDAMRVAAHLNIPFLTCDAEATYRDKVAQYFITEYTAGRTPNPDVLCNQYVKFGVFLDFAMQKGADYIATGHYVQKVDTPNGPELHRGVDSGKDQSYFLWSLTEEQLQHSLFPVGNTEKIHIRGEAEALKLPVSQKKDSQGICFLGHVDIPEFLSHYVDLTPGTVLDVEGNTIGTHKGALVYTIGQRHGFTLHTDDVARVPMFVIAKDIEKNTIVVSGNRPQVCGTEHLALQNTVLRAALTEGQKLEAQVRYRQRPFPVQVISVSPETLVVAPLADIDTPATGQSCVLYQGEHCIGGGLIQ